MVILVGLLIVLTPSVACAETYSISLSQGWNLISLPVQPVDSSIATVLGPVAGSVEIVWTYDFITKQWLKYRPGGQDNSLQLMYTGPGYWVHMKAPATLTVNCLAGVVPQAGLSAGWNLIGYYWTDNADVERVFANIRGKWKFIWGWENGTWKLKAAWNMPGAGLFPALTTLKKGGAYWVYLLPGEGRFWWEPDETPPAVVGASPLNNATLVSVDTTVTAEFGEPVDPATVTTATFTLRDNLNNIVPGAVTLTDRIAIFTPSQSLAPGKTYTARITTGVKDPSGNPMASAHSWSFTTRPSDVTAPVVASTSPSPDSRDVGTGSTIRATFSENIDPGSVTAATFVVRDGNNEQIPGNRTVLDNVVTFTPGSALGYSAVYTVTLTTGVKDLAGNGLLSNVSWTFSTVRSPQEAACGIWNGTFTSSAGYGSSTVLGMIAPNNEIHFVSSSAAQFNGTGSVWGASVTANLNAFAGPDMTFPNGSNYGQVTMNGTVSPKSSLTGTYSGVGDWGTFSLTYDPDYDRGASLNTIAGNWLASDPSGYRLTMTIGANGAFSGSDTNGCTFSGTAAVMNRLYNAYSVTMTLANCGALNGYYTGLGAVGDDVSVNDGLLIGVSHPTASITFIFRRN